MRDSEVVSVPLVRRKTKIGLVAKSCVHWRITAESPTSNSLAVIIGPPPQAQVQAQAAVRKISLWSSLAPFLPRAASTSAAGSRSMTSPACSDRKIHTTNQTGSSWTSTVVHVWDHGGLQSLAATNHLKSTTHDPRAIFLRHRTPTR